MPILVIFLFCKQHPGDGKKDSIFMKMKKPGDEIIGPPLPGTVDAIRVVTKKYTK